MFPTVQARISGPAGVDDFNNETALSTAHSSVRMQITHANPTLRTQTQRLSEQTQLIRPDTESTTATVGPNERQRHTRASVLPQKNGQ